MPCHFFLTDSKTISRTVTSTTAPTDISCCISRFMMSSFLSEKERTFFWYRFAPETSAGKISRRKALCIDGKTEQLQKRKQEDTQADRSVPCPQEAVIPVPFPVCRILFQKRNRTVITVQFLHAGFCRHARFGSLHGKGSVCLSSEIIYETLRPVDQKGTQQNHQYCFSL